MEKLLIIGGSDAGVSAALRARELDKSLNITVVLADAFPNFSICGLPFFISGETPDWRNLAHRTAADLTEFGFDLRLETRASNLNVSAHRVSLTDAAGRIESAQYDRLIVATGAVSARPSLEGLDLPGVFTLRWMKDAFAVDRFIEERRPKRAAIIGAGYIGLEMADALTRRGLETLMVVRSAEVLKTLDPELASLVRRELENNGVQVLTGRPPRQIVAADAGLKVIGEGGLAVEADMVLVAVGALPNGELAVRAGAETGLKGALKVDRGMRTNLPDVFAAGDCVETWRRLPEKYDYLPLGTTAHKQGRIAGENAVGGGAEFAGSLGAQAVKIFDLIAARTGLKHREAVEEGFDPLTVDEELWDHKAYYPGAGKLRIRLTGDKTDGRLLGAQIVGPYRAEISKRIDVFTAALYSGLKVEQLLEMDLSYTPPLAGPWDPIQMAALAWLKAQPR